MDSSIAHFIENQIKSVLSQDDPEIKLWYCEISSILKILFDIEKHPHCAADYNIARNKTIAKSDFAVNFLSDLELRALNNFKSFKKQMEWLSGRFLLKNCLSLFIENTGKLQNIFVSYEKEGAPFLPDFQDIKISLSHSGNIAAVGMSSKQNIDIGIDVEQIRKKPDYNFLKTAFTQKEISSMNDTVEDILQKWTAKEAFLKYIKKGFNESLHKVEVIENKIFHNKEEVQVKTYSEIIDNNYVFSMVTGRSMG